VLRGFGKDVTVLSADGVPDNYTFIPESETVVRQTGRRDFDVGMLVDSESTSRIGPAKEVVEAGRVAACVDHHVPNGEFGEIRVIDHGASSTAEVIVEWLDAAGVDIDSTAAAQLLTALVADTGGFRFANTKPRTLEVAARLTASGAQPSVIYREVFESKPLRAAKLLGRALTSLQTDPTGRIVWATVTRKDLDELNAVDADTESIVNHVGAVRGAKVAILFRETEPKVVRISLRSRDGFDVDRVARVFDGGGHVAAAGCTVRLPLDDARKAVLDEVAKWMDS
jgi:phosphoesterase RecJ-like protein